MFVDNTGKQPGKNKDGLGLIRFGMKTQLKRGSFVKEFSKTFRFITEVLCIEFRDILM